VLLRGFAEKRNARRVDDGRSKRGSISQARRFLKLRMILLWRPMHAARSSSTSSSTRPSAFAVFALGRLIGLRGSTLSSLCPRSQEFKRVFASSEKEPFARGVRREDKKAGEGQWPCGPAANAGIK
jgi:hypothetical protein